MGPGAGLRCDDGRIDPQHGVAADGAGAEARGEDPERLRDHAVGLRVGDGERDAGGRDVPDRLDVEVELVGVEPAPPASSMTIVLLAWCGTTRSMLSSSEPASPSGSGRVSQLVDHLLEVAAGQGFAPPARTR